ncbi:16S rRNA (adenine(1518)-N(6)/adenine(1519)-N(6))-dimethyltransferase RsmA [Yaniella halotolerans]|uniref:16S rRNA (adenine(1518)-N(6)/adenine(1519)-N(6))- dimethyltransferase RsmA n=1 Tax=Yaniella halotolerans TaxID=225453 RepID=UPI0003B43198|nr:16S rRNA (adenine(1518)-N(6)/adenine(1519)-N(6))-dimethyltransferase RsmA [Yaniella halotolerans]
MTSEQHALLSASDIRQLADILDLRPTKTLGQNYVIDPNTIRRIVGAAHLAATEHVLEIGPGLGSLTLGILDAAQAVTAIEIDPPVANRLATTVEQWRPDSAERLSVIEADALRITHSEIIEARPAIAEGPPTAIVANLPYNVAVPVMLHILAELPSIQHGLVMVQQEVAERIVAAPGSKIYGVPSVKMGWYAEATSAGNVGTKVFWPAPRITSGLVHFTARQPPATTATRGQVFEVIDAAFAQRRKTLRAALNKWAGSGAEAEELLVAADVDPKARGEILSVEQFARIAEQKQQMDAQ